MIKKLVQHIANILEVSEDDIEASQNFINFEKFDSLAMIQIAAMLDAEFDCIIEPEEFEFLDSMDSIINLVDLD